MSAACPAPREHDLRARMRRALRPPRILRPTRAGWCYFAITFCVGFAALNTGNNLLYLVLSLMLAFLVLSGVLSESALRGIAVRRIAPDELIAGRDAGVGIEVRNHAGRVAAHAIVVEDCLAVAAARPRRAARIEKAPLAGRCFALRVPAGGSVRRRYRLRPERRGSLALAGVRVTTRFPFGLFAKTRVFEAPETWLVYPPVDGPAAAAPRSDAPEGDDRRAPRPHAGADVAGVREHRPGDALRRVHWRASLRHGELLVREPEDPHGGRVEVRLRAADARPGAAFEDRVARAAAQVVAHLDAGLAVGLRCDAVQIPAASGAAQRARLLRWLACVEAGAGRPAARR